ncbi:Platelet-activating factor acetylhydrolase IB subunit gamma [Seminavis robusta]|uniref:Platelet-activating factor acetylhydrolase IB subunit gamma n=1 Tax=Seminavis robusta TaxID=568900 RepID=A0A9N8H229_9STRA|nr:Platelet-activating factor acetylhydrolase IB subunit gamma [Seminavis robusta]|eukprot:Sro28_g018630.1 Platelet-activating factor acetylhydrolase IB subunit gamma (453) ;mRNA; r:48041-49486
MHTADEKVGISMTATYRDKIDALYDELHAHVLREKSKERNLASVRQHYVHVEERLSHGMTLVKRSVEQSPRVTLFLVLSLTFLIQWTWSPFAQRDRHMIRHAMIKGDYSRLDVSYNFRIDEMEPQHWCLFGTDQQCPCEDPTHGEDRAEYKAWTGPHHRNVNKLKEATERKEEVDVVFIGDETVQSWEGMWFNHRCPQSQEIVGHWNRTFGAVNSPDSIKGMHLGISGDRITHVLWRLQHGEMPTEALNAKVIWLILGSRDLAVRLCSEEVVTLGILRIAEEIKHFNPQATVVVQSILPRTLHDDGSLESPHARPLKHDNLVSDSDHTRKGNKKGQSVKINTEYGELDEGLEALEEDEERQMHQAEPKYDYYLWPSIQNINREVEDFCNSHDGYEFFDAAPLFLTSRGNDRNHMFIQRELLRQYAQLSHEGHGVLLDAIQRRMEQILKRMES